MALERELELALTVCLFLKVTTAHCVPAVTVTLPPVGVTESWVHVPFGNVSVTV